MQDPWNTLPAWGYAFTDTAVSPTPDAGELIDDPLLGTVIGLTGYGWIAHNFDVEAGGYSSPSRGMLDFVGMDPTDPGSLHGIAPYGRIVYQTDLAGGTLEAGGNILKAAIFPGRDRSSGFADRYTDWGVDSSWQKSVGKGDLLTANIRFEHENGNLRASCTLGLIAGGTNASCARYHLNEWRGAVRYVWHGKVGFVLSPFSITGYAISISTRAVVDLTAMASGQIDFTPWGSGNSPLGPRFNARVGVQYTLYGKFNGRRHIMTCQARMRRTMML